MEVHQRINTKDIVYSLKKKRNDSKYLICSLSDGKMLIFLLKGNKYEKLQILVKPEHLQKGAINKVITLSDGNLATAERGAISIWKSLFLKRGNKFEFSKEIITENDTFQLLEVNPQVLVCGIYSTELIILYKKLGEDYLLHEKVTNVQNHGNNSNGMAKINDNLFCVAGKNSFIFIVSIELVKIL